MGLLGNYKVLIIGCASVALIHFGWYKLQFNENFVNPSERKVKMFGVDFEQKFKKAEEVESK